MLNDITLGQYYPSESPLHRLDPRIKVLLSVIFIVLLFVIKGVWGYLLCTVITVAGMILSGIPLRTFISGLKPIIFIVCFTFLINVFWTRGENLIFEWKFIHIYSDGLLRAFFMAYRIVLLITGSGLFLTYTTTPIMLTDALESLFSPLKKIKVPVHEFAMMMTIALRFIPTLIEETDRILDAQKARGAQITGKGLVKKVKALIPVLVPLFVCSFKRADELAVAMECRCYRGGEGRTKLNVLKLRTADVAVFVFFSAVLAAVIALNAMHLPFVV